MNYKNLTVAAGIALSLVLSIFGLTRHSLPAPVAQEQAHKVGAVVNDTSITVNGVTTWTLRQNMAVATTTLCSFGNPAGNSTTTLGTTGQTIPQVGLATSTLVGISVQITTGTGTSATFDIATSTSPWATSSVELAYGVSVASNALYSGAFAPVAQGQATSSSDLRLSASYLTDANRVGPAEYVNVKTATAGSGGYTYGGQCIAIFRSLNAI